MGWGWGGVEGVSGGLEGVLRAGGCLWGGLGWLKSARVWERRFGINREAEARLIPSPHHNDNTLNTHTLPQYTNTHTHRQQKQVTSNFGKRLAPLGLLVRELTGDMQLSKKELAETQMVRVFGGGVGGCEGAWLGEGGLDVDWEMG